MQHKSHKWLVLLTFFIILPAGLLIAASPNYAQQEEPYPVEVRFADNVTLEQASTIIAQTNATIESQWRWQIIYHNPKYIDNVWSGGVDFAPGQNLQAAHGQIWKEFIGLVTYTKQSVGSRIDTHKTKSEDVPLNRQRQYDANLHELEWLQNNVVGCWDTNTCPPIPIYDVTIMATKSTIDQLESSTLIQKIDPVFPPTAFFLMKALGFLPQD